MVEPLFVALGPGLRDLDELVGDALAELFPAAATARELARRIFGDLDASDVRVREVETALERLVLARAVRLAEPTAEQRMLRAERLSPAPWAALLAGDA